MKRFAIATLIGSFPIAFLLTGLKAAESVSALDMAERVDVLLSSRWREAGVAAAPPSDASEFIRRIHLDLVGVVPRVADVREFLADPREDKRAEIIDRLLASPRHATHLANTWRQILLPGSVDFEQLQSMTGVQNWLRRQFAANMRYDRLVSEFLVASGGGSTGPALFYTSLELQPEKLAASTSRIFLGLQIECAECHDHPFDEWTQEDFWGYAAFFAQLDRSAAMGGARQVALVDLDQGEVTLPNSSTTVAPKYPAGRVADRSHGGSRRVQLAIWMASRDNPFLARAAVNRVWAHLFGRGLVEPVDDLGKHNPASHPQLFDELTDYFVASGFDLRALYRALANSRAYQLSSRVDGEPLPQELFASMAVKTMTADQLYDSLLRVLLRPSPARSTFAFGSQNFDPGRLAFTAKMQLRGSNATEFQAGVLQALTMLNGSDTTAVTDAERSGLLMALEAPWFSDESRLEALFLATLARLPDADEQRELGGYLAAASAADRRPTALGDVLWALINSAEFSLNH